MLWILNNYQFFFYYPIQVFECVIAWVNYDLESRQKHVAELMEYVRLPLLSEDYLIQRVEEETVFKNDIRCKDYLIEALKYHILVKKGEVRNETNFKYSFFVIMLQ